MAVQLPDSDSDRTTCDYCEAHVTAHFRRTYGTEDRRAICGHASNTAGKSLPQGRHDFEFEPNLHR
ncbi:DUF7563 family protein [Halorussus limi]|uniref:DUF7563 family protein n=1 Tax=Halorussus limi TaxID=2938695 RepID=UPI003F5E0C93